MKTRTHAGIAGVCFTWFVSSFIPDPTNPPADKTTFALVMLIGITAQGYFMGVCLYTVVKRLIDKSGDKDAAP
jgi:ABC-type branched-subunit amino acid transport system permease subunit